MEYGSGATRKDFSVFLIPKLQYSIAPALHALDCLRASLKGSNSDALWEIEYKDLSVAHTS